MRENVARLKEVLLLHKQDTGEPQKTVIPRGLRGGAVPRAFQWAAPDQPANVRGIINLAVEQLRAVNIPQPAEAIGWEDFRWDDDQALR
jgi:hypothetical protein